MCEGKHSGGKYIVQTGLSSSSINSFEILLFSTKFTKWLVDECITKAWFRWQGRKVYGCLLSPTLSKMCHLLPPWTS